MTVAIWVLSPISAKKKATTVVPNTPYFGASCASPSSSLSGTSIHAAMAKNDTPSTQRNTVGPMNVVSHVPKLPAKAWLAKVATKMPHTIGQGWRKRVARRRAKSCVLSPISASATMPVEMKKASMGSS